MAEGAAAVGDLLDRAVAGQETALLQLARRVTSLIEGWGAYTVQSDWRILTQEATQQALDGWRSSRREAQAAQFLEGIVRNRFWGEVLDEMSQNNPRAGELLFPTIRRLLARWDGSRRFEASWDDVVQEATHQLWERWATGEVERPWSLLCTIAKRRFLDQTRRAKATEDPEILDDLSEEGEESPGGEVFAQQALDVLEPEERGIVVRMDIEGQTRVEIARELEMTEGQVLSIRRAGLRRIWRWAGADLPPEIRDVWEAMFKGAKRAGPEQVAAQLGITPGEVEQRVEQARVLLGLAG